MRATEVRLTPGPLNRKVGHRPAVSSAVRVMGPAHHSQNLDAISAIPGKPFKDRFLFFVFGFCF
jgi:hypothetical protein